MTESAYDKLVSAFQELELQRPPSVVVTRPMSKEEREAFTLRMRALDPDFEIHTISKERARRLTNA